MTTTTRHPPAARPPRAAMPPMPSQAADPDYDLADRYRAWLKAA